MACRRREGERERCLEHARGPAATGKVKNGLLHDTDYNCDGRADISLPGTIVFGGSAPETALSIARVGTGDVGHPALVREADEMSLQWGTPVGIGDVNGDGCGDAEVYVARGAVQPDDRIRVRLLVAGYSDAAIELRAQGVLLRDVIGVGDVDGDGYADVAEQVESKSCVIYAGGPGGVTDRVLGRASRCGSGWGTGRRLFLSGVGVTCP